MHTVYQNRKRSFKCQRSQRMYPFKKRKLLHSLPSISDGTTRSDYEATHESLEKATDMSASDFGASGHGGACHLYIHKYINLLYILEHVLLLKAS